MSIRKRTCCVPNCEDKISRRFSLPTNEELRNIWLNRIGSDKLLMVPDERIRNYVICANHFDAMCFDAGGKLLNFSLPTINLAGFHDAPSRENCFMISRESVLITPGFHTPKKIKEALETIAATPSSLTGVSPVGPVTAASRVYTKRQLFESEETQDSCDNLGVAPLLPEIDWSLIIGDVGLPLDVAGPSRIAEVVESSTYLQQYNVGSIIDVAGPSRVTEAAAEPATSTSNNAEVQQVSVKRVNLKLLGLTRVKQLTPECKILYQQLKNLKRTVHRLNISNKKNINRCKLLSSKDTLLRHIKNVNEFTKTFILSQTANQRLKPRGRRYTIDDKILALSIYKQSGKGYRFLSKIFSLPSRKTLINLLRKIPIYCGINEHIIKHLEASVKKLNIFDKNCVLMFDEVSLELGLQYNFKMECVEGFVDLGGANRQAKFADHALVFLLKGIHKKWKQPVCFTFCESTTQTAELVKLIKSVVRSVRETGLYIVATISDQGATNAAAVRRLIKNTNAYCLRQEINNTYQGYLIDGIEVVHLYDIPHLFKGLRNGILKSDLQFTLDAVVKVASWSHLVQLYNIDKKMGRFSMVHKLTDEHVLPEKIRKMKVKHCTQVFSRTVATAMKTKAVTSKDLEPTSDHYLDPQASDTADLFLFLDELFDSLNGSQIIAPFGKPLRSVVTQTSNHVNFWNSALPVLQSMIFLKPDKSSYVTPSIKNLVFTIHGFLYIWNVLKEKKFRYMAPRAFNQDPIENFFSCIRSYGIRNTNPTCSSFISSTKALLINGFVSPHSIGSNCEEDESIGVLNTLKSFVEVENMPAVVECPEIPCPIYETVEIDSYNHPIDFSTPYVAGIVAKKLLLQINCEHCRQKMETLEEISQNILIEAREYREGERHLMHPSSVFYKAFRHIANLIYYIIPKVIIFYNIKNHITSKLEAEEDLSFVFCEQHGDFQKIFYKISTNIILFHYLANINKILRGVDLRHKDDDQLTKMAFVKFSKKRRR